MEEAAKPEARPGLDEVRGNQYYGYSMHWESGLYYEADELEAYRQIGDPEMDHILELCTRHKIRGAGRFDDIVEHSESAYTRAQDKNANLSPAELALSEFYNHYHDRIPEWVDWNQLQRGIDLFVTHSVVAFMALFYGSLVPGFSAPKITKVLMETKYLAPPSSAIKSMQRLVDTTGFVSSIMATTADGNDSNIPAASIRPGGVGWKTALRVRALHAKVRRALLQSKSRPWDKETYGIPINQEDMAVTLLAFSATILQCIDKVAGGASLSEQDRLDYLALWRYVGWLMGVGTVEVDSMLQVNDGLLPLDPCGPPPKGGNESAYAHALAVEKSIWCHLAKPDETSIAAAHHLLRIGWSPDAGIITSEYHSYTFLFNSLMCRYFSTNELADALQLPYFSDNKYSIRFYLVWIYIEIVWFWLQLGTWFLIKSSLCRRLSRRLHIVSINAYKTTWALKHDEWMAKAKNFARGKSAKFEERVGSSSPCPFALVMPPRLSTMSFRISAARPSTRKRTFAVSKPILAASVSAAAADVGRGLGSIEDEEDLARANYLRDVASSMRKSVSIRDRKYRLITYRNCFVGSEAVDFMVRRGYAASRQEAVALGREIASTLNAFSHVVGGHLFKDDYLFYRFEEVPSVANAAGLDTIAEEKRLNAGSKFGSDELSRIEAKLKAGLAVKTRSHHFRQYKDCFIAQEAVTFMVERGIALSRQRAVELGRAMELEHVTGDHTFQDAYLFFRFKSDQHELAKIKEGNVSLRTIMKSLKIE